MSALVAARSEVQPDGEGDLSLRQARRPRLASCSLNRCSSRPLRIGTLFDGQPRRHFAEGDEHLAGGAVERQRLAEVVEVRHHHQVVLSPAQRDVEQTARGQAETAALGQKYPGLAPAPATVSKTTSLRWLP